MTAPSPVLMDRLAALELEQSQPVIYDRPVGLRLLYQDPATGAEHYLVRYPPGLQAEHHRHTAAHTIIVLEGAMELDGQVLPPGSTLTTRRGHRCTTLPLPASTVSS